MLVLTTLVAAFLASLWGCGSNRDSDGTTTPVLTPEEVQATATYVGSSKCLSCHNDKGNWGHTLHKLTLRKPLEFSPLQASAAALYGDTINRGIKLSLGSGNDGIEDDFIDAAIRTPDDGEAVVFYFDTTKTTNAEANWKTHYQLGLGTTPVAALPATVVSGTSTFAKKYSAQVVRVDGNPVTYEVQLNNLSAAGTASYRILFSYGGERNFKQRYVLALPATTASKHISPLQYNDRWLEHFDEPATALANKWVGYHAERWYNPLNNSNTLATPGKTAAFDGDCAGCHFTGYTLAKNEGGDEVADAVDDPNGAVDFDGDGSLDEINVGCEACHGAGSVHVETLNPAWITNPANLTREKADMVCGQCHIRGKSNDQFADLADASGSNFAPFPAKLETDGSLRKFRPGDDLTEFYVFDGGADPVDAHADGAFASQYWGGEPSGGDFVASKQHHQQYIDYLQGPHAPGTEFDGTCFTCHDLHDNRGPEGHQIATTVEEDGVTVSTADDNDTLCLTCHAGREPFADLTVEEVADVKLNRRFNNVMANYIKAVTDHTQHYFDPDQLDEDDESDPLDGVSEGSSRCSECHMPKTAKTALNYDIRSHVMETIEPSQSLSTAPSAGVPNSCNAKCHTTSSFTDDAELQALQDEWDAKFEDGTNTVFPEWATSGHADYEGEPFNHWNGDGEVEADCARCHSKDGFRDYALDGAVDEPARLGTVISCGACHTLGDSPEKLQDSSTLWDDRATFTAIADVTFPSGAVRSLEDDSNMCMACHQGRESGLTVANEIATNPGGPHSFINRHYFAAAAILFGTEVQAGFEYPGKVYQGQNTYPGHVTAGFDLLDTCSGCHLREGAMNHTFEPDITRCGACHVDSGTAFPGTLTSFENLGLPFGTGAVDFDVDYDGDGVGESFQGEIDGLAGDGLNKPAGALLTAIQTYASANITPIVYGPGSYPYWFKDTDADGIADAGEINFGNRFTTFDDTLLKAAYNFHSAQDPCGDMHNYKYVIQTLIDSIEDLGGDIASFTRP
jgi:nitrate reductase cytochrome c-type subunit